MFMENKTLWDENRSRPEVYRYQEESEKWNYKIIELLIKA